MNKPKANRGACALRRAIDTRELTQGDVRRALGVASGMVTRWLSGDRKPGARNAAKIQKMYGVRLEWWWEDESDAEDPPGKTGTDC